MSLQKILQIVKLYLCVYLWNDVLSLYKSNIVYIVYMFIF